MFLVWILSLLLCYIIQGLELDNPANATVHCKVERSHLKAVFSLSGGPTRLSGHTLHCVSRCFSVRPFLQWPVRRWGMQPLNEIPIEKLKKKYICQVKGYAENLICAFYCLGHSLVLEAAAHSVTLYYHHDCFCNCFTYCRPPGT